jgi:trk system potassium uptake protein TrkH
MGSFADFSILSKVTFIVDMILGRLEIIPVVVLFSPFIWKRN